MQVEDTWHYRVSEVAWDWTAPWLAGPRSTDAGTLVEHLVTGEVPVGHRHCGCVTSRSAAPRCPPRP